MDQRRTSTRQAVPSKTSIVSRNRGGGGGTTGVAETGMKKYGSQASLTPSQAAQRSDPNSRKSPLDALSRNTLRQEAVQKRSGLQDVDEAYLNSNIFSRPSRVRHSGLGDDTPYIPQQQQQQSQVAQAQLTPVRMVAGNETVGAVPSQQSVAQQQQPPPQQQQMQQPPMQQQQSQPIQQQQQAMPPQQQQQHAAPPTSQPVMQSPRSSGGAGQHQHQHSPRSEHGHGQRGGHQQQQHQQQQQIAAGGHAPQSANKYQQQHAYNQQSGDTIGRSTGGGGGGATQQQQQQQQQQNISQAPPEAEMCTTCPNCQTTIYLVRSPEMGNGDGGYANGPIN